MAASSISRDADSMLASRCSSLRAAASLAACNSLTCLRAQGRLVAVGNARHAVSRFFNLCQSYERGEVAGSFERVWAMSPDHVKYTCMDHMCQAGLQYTAQRLVC
eukprot:142942-Rhodomonas_salina.2